MGFNYDVTPENWTIEYFEELNKYAESIGCDFLKVIIDRENKIVYKDDFHRFLGIGIKL